MQFDFMDLKRETVGMDAFCEISPFALEEEFRQWATAFEPGRALAGGVRPEKSKSEILRKSHSHFRDNKILLT